MKNRKPEKVPEQHQHKIYTATDIEKYHKGLLSPREMNELERAALDDPFLADALEGFGNVKVNLAADMDDLGKKLEQRLGQDKVVKMTPRSGFSRLLRIAVVIVVVAGAALSVYRFGFNTGRNSIAKNEESKKQEQAAQQQTIPVEPSTESNQVRTDSSTRAATPGQGTVTLHWQSQKNPADSLTRTYTLASPLSAASIAPSKDTVETYKFNTADADARKTEAPQDYSVRSNSVMLDSFKAGSVRDQSAKYYGENTRQFNVKDKAVAASNARGVVAPAKVSNISNNYFNGRVVDNSDNAVPFANVTNIKDNVGTYADANGYFTLISPDTALNLRIKSVGFMSDTVQLQKNVAASQVTLKEDKLNGIVLGQKRIGNKPKPEDNIKIEEPEPADGWSNYGLYLANNLKVPEEIKKRELTGEVQLSFEINKLGQPVNIKVEKSLCKECDEEAKRLVMQGPKWKIKKEKNNRVIVTVPFQMTE